MKLEQYISDLLYRYDLVIIPDFGGIVGRRKNARYDEATFIFSPPYKELSFNGSLVENDWLLARYVASVKDISNEEALQLINSQTQHWKFVLQKFKRLKLNQIGIFNLTDDNTIVFLPLTTKNYLREAYGLNSFIHKPVSVHKPVTVENVETQKITQPIQRNTMENTSNFTPLSVKPPKKRKNTSRVLKYAAVFVVGLALLGGGVAYYMNQQKQQPVYQKATFILPENFPSITIGKTIDNDKSKENHTTTALADYNYFIVTGAFRNKRNAEKKVKDLIAQGYPATIIGKNKYNLWMVASEGFTTYKAAHQKLSKIKRSQKGAWVFAKK